MSLKHELEILRQQKEALDRRRAVEKARQAIADTPVLYTPKLDKSDPATLWEKIKAVLKHPVF